MSRASTSRQAGLFQEAAAGLVAAARSDVGRVRTQNEDSWVCQPARGLFAVIDGMGGQNAGEVAAAITRRALLERPDSDTLRVAIQSANEQVVHQAQRSAGERGMGCVVTAVQVRGAEIEVAHVGDTRAYLASAAGCEQLTRDHTAVAEAQESLGLSEVQARNLPGQHQVTRDVGRAFHPDLSWIESSTAPFVPGDLLLLCTDGLHDLVPHGEIARILGAARKEGREPAQLVEKLVDLALERGGRDNVTVVVARRNALPRPPRAWPVWACMVLAFLLVLGMGVDAYRIVSHRLNPEFPVSRISLGSLQMEASAPLTWSLRVAAGTRFEVVDTVLTLPNLELQVDLEDSESRVILHDTVMDIGSLVVRGPPGSRCLVEGGRIQLRQQGERPLVEGGDLFWDDQPIDPMGPTGVRVPAPASAPPTPANPPEGKP